MMNMSEATKNAVIDNNNGVEYLQQGQYETALQHFERAAQHLHGIACSFASNPTSNARHYSIGVFFKKNSATEKENPLFFSNPIAISEYGDDALSPEACSLLSAVVLYNMGLTYHLSFVISHPFNESLPSAMQMYEMACTLGLQARPAGRSSHIVMAALNNLGELHHELGDFESSKACLEDLSYYISCIDDPMEGEDAVQRHEFVLNSMVLGATHGAAAA